MLVHENCAGWAGTSADRMLDLLARWTAPRCGCCSTPATASPTATGRYPVLLRATSPRMSPTSTSRTPSAPDGGTAYTLPGQRAGAGGGMPAAACRGQGYTGALSIEPHLALRPHEARPGTGDHAGFVASGRALIALARDKSPRTFLA